MHSNDVSIVYVCTCTCLIILSFNPEIPVITSSDDLVVNQNSSFSLTCNYTGVPSPIITWYKDDIQLSSSNPDKINILTNQIIVYLVTEGDEGVYQCRVVNQVGSSEADIAVDVIRKF